MKYKVALLIPEFDVAGGVTAVGLFLRDVLSSTDRYHADVISLAMGARDPVSSQMLAPGTWARGAEIAPKTWDGIPYQHAGARWAELEFQRYRPRPSLTRLLRSYDLIQVVAGTPPWAHVAKEVDVPVALQVATLTRVEREGQGSHASVARRIWQSGMTRVATWMEDAISEFVDAIFVENAWMHNHYSNSKAQDAVHFAPPGVDTSLFHPPEEPSSRENYILCVGRLDDPRKNIGLLFRAYYKLRQLSPTGSMPRLVLAGLSGPSDRDWRLASDLGIRHAIQMHEQVPKQDLAELYRRARLFVLSSNEEGFGIVLAEAMASGTPVVSTDCGGPSTLIEHEETGLLTPTGNSEALAEAMKDLLTHPEVAQQIGDAGRVRIEEKFSNQAAGRRYLRVYDGLLDKK